MLCLSGGQSYSQLLVACYSYVLKEMLSAADATVQVASFLVKIFTTVIISSQFAPIVALLLWFL